MSAWRLGCLQRALKCARALSASPRKGTGNVWLALLSMGKELTSSEKRDDASIFAAVAQPQTCSSHRSTCQEKPGTRVKQLTHGSRIDYFHFATKIVD
eukprot:1671771-Amphidinium_carterae.1